MIAIFAAGCFWCYEAVFKEVKGVTSVLPGYIGGTVPNPTYAQVSSAETGHAEAVKIEFNESEVSYNDLLDIFWHVHDPTTLNRQGNDIGTQYRSSIFYINDSQKDAAESMKKQLEESNEFENPIVTEIVPATQFYVAEDYHKDYYESHKNAPYCQVIISPKMKKFRERYKEKLKSK